MTRMTQRAAPTSPPGGTARVGRNNTASDAGEHLVLPRRRAVDRVGGGQVGLASPPTHSSVAPGEGSTAPGATTPGNGRRHRPISHPVVRAALTAEADARYAGITTPDPTAGALTTERMEWLAREVYRFPSTRWTVAHRGMARVIIAELNRRIEGGT